MAFPRLNALSYWIYVAAGIFLYVGFLTGNGPNDGWFNYVPYASRNYNPGLNQDFYSLGMVFLGISTTVGAANFIVTAFRTRAPGMSINRLPIMVWGTLTASAANLIVVPAVSLAFFLLWMDRQFGTHFFDTAGGGQRLLWQHLFWIFGHPWVYAIVLPLPATLAAQKGSTPSQTPAPVPREADDHAGWSPPPGTTNDYTTITTGPQ
jgi:heme/copper-type cytochrome/quinol oxidase subunit 1